MPKSFSRRGLGWLESKGKSLLKILVVTATPPKNHL